MLKLKVIINEIKILLERFRTRCEEEEYRICKLKGRQVDVVKLEKHEPDSRKVFGTQGSVRHESTERHTHRESPRGREKGEERILKK